GLTPVFSTPGLICVIFVCLAGRRVACEERVWMWSRKWLIVALVVCGISSACSDYNTNLSIQTSASSVSSVSPATATLNNIPAGGLPIVVNGVGFVSGAFILWNANTANQLSLLTEFVNSSQLKATVPVSAFPTSVTSPLMIPIAVDIPGSATSGTNINSTTTT